MPQGIEDFVRKQPHVTLATGTVIHAIGGLESMTGIDLETFDKMSGGLDYRQGGPFQSDYDILIDQHYADQRDLNVGSKVELAGHNWTVRGIVGPGKLSKIFAQRKVLQDITSNTGKISMVYVKVDDKANMVGVIQQLRSKLEGYPIFSMEEFLSLITTDNIPGLNAFITTVVGLAIVFGFLVVFLAMYTAVLERTREIGILKALGATPAYIIGMLMRETVVLAIIGSLIGIALSFVAKGIITAVVPASLPVVSVPDWWWRAALISLAGAVFGAIYPGTKAARQDTIEALAYE
jgi:putative ABC transport system permease protein